MPSSNGTLSKNTQGTKMNNNTNPQPVKISQGIRLDLSSRLYLAISRKDITDKLIHVYTLGCRGENGRFYLNPTTDIATFDNPQTAELYTNSVSQIMQAQTNWPAYSTFRNVLKAEMEMFIKMTK